MRLVEAVLFAACAAAFRLWLLWRAVRRFARGRLLRVTRPSGGVPSGKRPGHVLVLLPPDAALAAHAARVLLAYIRKMHACTWLTLQIIEPLGTLQSTANSSTDRIDTKAGKDARSVARTAARAVVDALLDMTASDVCGVQKRHTGWLPACISRLFARDTEEMESLKALLRSGTDIKDDCLHVRPVEVYVNHTAVRRAEAEDALSVNVISEDQRLHHAAVVCQLRTAGVTEIDASALSAHLSPAPSVDLVIDAVPPDARLPPWLSWAADLDDGPHMRSVLAWNVGFAEIYRADACTRPAFALVDAAMLGDAFGAYACCGQRWGA